MIVAHSGDTNSLYNVGNYLKHWENNVDNELLPTKSIDRILDRESQSQQQQAREIEKDHSKALEVDL